MKDRIGNVLSVGDKVAYISSSVYKSLRIGTVVGFTPCFIKVDCDTIKSPNAYRKVENRDSSQVIKYLKDDPQVTWEDL